MPKLNWKNLHTNQCPRCGNELTILPKLKTFNGSPVRRCESCRFHISEQKVESILNSRKQRSYMREIDSHDNQADLNNLGRTPVSEDFSDSPALNDT